jgi:hypothetical protein
MPKKKYQSLFDKRLLPKNYGRCSKSVHRQGPVDIMSINGGSFVYKFYITYRINEPVIYETNLSTGGFAYKLTWKVGPRVRNYYRKGDIILYGQAKQKWLQRMFPTLRPKSRNKSLLQWIIDSEALGPSPLAKYAFVIWNIRPVCGSPGYGVIYLKPILFFGDSAVLLLDEENKRYTTRDFNANYPLYKSAKNMKSMLPYIHAALAIVQAWASGGTKQIATESVSFFVVKKGAVKAATILAEKQLKRALLKKMAKEIFKANIAATTAFVMEFLKKITVQQEELLRKMADKTAHVDYHVFNSALKWAIQAYVITFINACLGATISSFAKQSGLENSLKEYFAKKLLTSMNDIVNALVTAYRKSAEEKSRLSPGDKPSKNAAQKNIISEFKGLFFNTMSGILKDSISNA